jgi:hypothetical protein
MKYLLFLPLWLCAHASPAQTLPPIIRASSKTVSIRDGDFLDKDRWTLSPKARPDVFTADRTRKTKWVTFYTDMDSIRIKVKPGTKYDFVILLNGKDSCYTEVVSAIPRETAGAAAGNDTIPFLLNAYNAIQVKTVINDTVTVNLHFDVSTFDFVLTRDAIAQRHLGKVDKLQMGTMVWSKPEVHRTLVTSHNMDGRFGANLFEGKQVELDYDHHLLIVHSRLPGGLKGYSRSAMEFIRSFACARGTFKIGHQTYEGMFMFDTGSDQAVIVDSTWAARAGLPKDLKLIKTTVLHDPRGVRYESRTVLVPAITLNGFTQTNVPTLLLGSKNPVDFEVNYFGNDFLKRFNIIFDFKTDRLYVKPNTLMDVKYAAAG